MATTTICYTPIKGRVIRVVLLDACGVPVCGDGSALIVASGYTKVDQKAQYDTGAEFIVRTADDELCVNEKAADALKRLEVTMEWCQIDPGLVVNTISPSRLLNFSQPGIGTGFALAEGTSSLRFSHEVWQRVTGDSACDEDGNPQWVYNAWPNLGNGKIGDYSIAAEPSKLIIIAESKKVSPLWWIGEDWLGEGAVQIIPDHWFQNVTTVAPPEPTCGIQDLACIS